MNATLLASIGLTFFAAGSLALPMDSSPTATNAIGGGDNPYPHREKYKECTPISTEDLAALGDVFLVDTRNKAEFDVIHMAGATNLIVSDMKLEDLLAIRGKEGDKPIVFYCNGHT